MWVWGDNYAGKLGLNSTVQYSSPVQLPGTTWASAAGAYGSFAPVGSAFIFKSSTAAIKTDGTLWTWGENEFGALGMNTPESSLVSSPVQVPGTTWSKVSGSNKKHFALKTDGTLWSWGYNANGALGLNEAYTPSKKGRSSPAQIPGTTWATVARGNDHIGATKTDGTLWMWGINYYGALGLNNKVNQSSPTQVPGTTWDNVIVQNTSTFGTKTDGTLWAWGGGQAGLLGLNNPVNTHLSSPTQIPGTNWSVDDIEGFSGGVLTAGLKTI